MGATEGRHLIVFDTPRKSTYGFRGAGIGVSLVADTIEDISDFHVGGFFKEGPYKKVGINDSMSYLSPSLAVGNGLIAFEQTTISVTLVDSTNQSHFEYFILNKDHLWKT